MYYKYCDEKNSMWNAMWHVMWNVEWNVMWDVECVICLQCLMCNV